MLTLNTAGSNLYLFSCPSAEALMQWTAALRLSAWEKSRLEEIYTAHLIRISMNDGASCLTVRSELQLIDKDDRTYREDRAYVSRGRTVGGMGSYPNCWADGLETALDGRVGR